MVQAHRAPAIRRSPRRLRLMAFNRISTASESGHGPADTPLEGKALLDRARSLSNRPEDQIARACGYVGPSGRILKKSFYRALVAAKGYVLPSSQAGHGSVGSKGRQAEFQIGRAHV